MASKTTPVPIRINPQYAPNPYRDNVQGKANEPITIAGLLDRAHQLLGLPIPDVSLEAIYDRLESNAPRIAVIGGSPDHPAHILDLETQCRAVWRIWNQGGVPFAFSIPTICDGTAQNNIGMSYSLESRNAATQMVVTQMDGQSYHGAFVIQGCDKTPLAILSALANLDTCRQNRGDLPVWATFAPSHVLKGGTIPPDLNSDLETIAHEAEYQGHPDIAEDIRDALDYILQCSSNTAFQGVLTRAEEIGLLTAAAHKELEKRLAVNTCDAKGGICAFNGTGNSSRNVMSAFGMVHPAVELLTEPPSQERVNQAVDALFGFWGKPEYSAANIMAQNYPNAIRVHSAAGGSTNLMMHLVAGMVYGGYNVSLMDQDAIRRRVPVPDLFNYSLTEGRDIFRLAEQCCSGQIRGMETMIYELVQNGVPMHLDAPTVTGTTWRERLADETNLPATGVTENPIILAQPRRKVSGVDVLSGNFFETAVVKISGMPEKQVDEFDEKVAFVYYFENEDDANQELLNLNILDDIKQRVDLDRSDLIAMYEHNATPEQRSQDVYSLEYNELFDYLASRNILRFAIVISGQGPDAFGMPEMFTPMQHINANRKLRKLTVCISDGRYSGVTYGAAIGHMTPEAKKGGKILYLQSGDILHLRLRDREINLLDRAAFRDGRIENYQGDLAGERQEIGLARMDRIITRRRMVSSSARLSYCTDAAHGVVPLEVAEEATRPYTEPGV